MSRSFLCVHAYVRFRYTCIRKQMCQTTDATEPCYKHTYKPTFKLTSCFSVSRQICDSNGACIYICICLCIHIYTCKPTWTQYSFRFLFALFCSWDSLHFYCSTYQIVDLVVLHIYFLQSKCKSISKSWEAPLFLSSFIHGCAPEPGYVAVSLAVCVGRLFVFSVLEHTGT